MYDDGLKDIAIRNLEQKAIGIVQTHEVEYYSTVALTAQGYIVNRAKQTRLQWSSILLHAFENIDILTPEQQNYIEVLYNKIYNS